MRELRGGDPAVAFVVSYVSLPEASHGGHVLDLFGIDLPGARPGCGTLGLMAVGNPDAAVFVAVEPGELVVLLIFGRHGIRGLFGGFDETRGGAHYDVHLALVIQRDAG